MKKQEALNRIEAQKETIIELTGWAVFRYIDALLEQIDEPETGHADEAPRYVKNILARLRELPLHDREVWLKVIISEFKQDFSHAKWREGYEQGKIEGMLERDKVTIPKYIADKIEYCKESGDWDLFQAMDYCFNFRECSSWLEISDNQETFARAWLDGYEVEKEPKYIVKIKGILKANEVLNYKINEGKWVISSGVESTFYRTKHTRKQLEEAGFGWIFSCEGIEVKEVE